MTPVEDQSQRAVPRVALGVTGGIAAYKSIEVLRGLQRHGCDVRVAMTRHACEFVQPLTFRALSGAYVVVDDYSPDNPDPIAHITFSQSVDLFVVAPATANTLAKMANGIADDFISSTYLACTAPVLIAPAMNTAMWNSPATQRNVQKLRGDGVYILEPDAGEMACRTIGPGRLTEPERIVTLAMQILNERLAAATPADLSGEKILITAGGTREAIDPVRFISNRSSGRMGFAIAEAAHRRGARVNVIAGTTSVHPPANVPVTHVTTAAEMHQAVCRLVMDTTVFVSAAAVSDYRVKDIAKSKIKKSASELTLALERTADILGDVAINKKPGQVIVGFAAETDNVLANARAKLVAKNLDMIVANDVTRSDAGFDSEANVVTILLRNSDPVALPMMPKIEVANHILDEIVKLRRQATIARTA